MSSNFFNQPYPFNYRGRPLLIFVVGIFFLAFYITYFLQPFTNTPEEYRVSFFWICIIHAGIAMASALLASLVLAVAKVREEKWTIKHELILLTIALFLIGVGNFLVRNYIYDNPHNFTWRYFNEEVSHIMIIGVVVIFLLVSFNFNRLLIRNQNKAQKLHFEPQKIQPEPNLDIIDIQTPVKKEAFSLNLANFLFAKADGNYVEIKISKDNRIENQLIRITISELKKQLANYSYIMKTHRAYLVNLKKIQSVNGNAQGYRLMLAQIDEQVPVSRGNIVAFEQRVSGFKQGA